MSHLNKPSTHKTHKKDPTLLEILNHDPWLNQLDSYNPKIRSKLITLQLINQNFHSISRSFINKQTAHKIYQIIYSKSQYSTPQNINKYNYQILNQAQFGKFIKILFPNVVTKRLGSRINSLYVYYGITTKPHLNQLVSSIEQISPVPQPPPPNTIQENQFKFEIPTTPRSITPISQDPKPQNIILPDVLFAYLQDLPISNPILIRCDSLLLNFKNFNLIQMNKDWFEFEFEINNIFKVYDGFNFKLMEIFNTGFNLNPMELGLEFNELINPLKLNILILLLNLYKSQQKQQGYLNYLEFQFKTNEILILFTKNKKITFGNFWILKCYLDEFYNWLIKNI
ncbi:hypothetical protein BN7_5390 [Wickerhamomyces ciferrii]|uniref:RFX-type winged-helix domain-containing protein n=1 Tax=Wickerhamomyces ciferrii (strain ATCC 14091 / BCRC 22168 / CBS 111 / JCM 3599 / NBRC 0793 / NRRL Y-1031 F-60-10) TaxID=1206466 RepID=K0KWE1_WICCF|nr:uncharacterized protein BN7_5390 [Wickerhamomyces ciferrii]CCH45804.1 hypothetical protein BN7_5390 [Wickerhamomyces ciferrii]